MKIKFDSNQKYQLDAVNAVVDLFDGQPLAGGDFEFNMATDGGLFSDLGIGNHLSLSDDALLSNLRKVQERNDIPLSDELNGLHFSVEMETGTGKTYVYLRSIYELHQRYGFKKFIIVVPSVAIREGVMTSLRLMKDHFTALYGNVPADSWVYDSRKISKLRQFSQSNTLQILVINIDAFNKKANNVIHKENDRLSGYRPVEFVNSAHPIVIMDEPQNMESEQAKEAIASLNPLCTLRYSATHRNLYNQLYRLDPVRAYDLKLVKRIEVDSVLDDSDFNQPYIFVKSISATAAKITAKLTLDVNEKKLPKRKTITIDSGGIDLYEKTKQRSNYAGYIVDEINAGDGYVSFSNGLCLYVGQTHGGRVDDVMRVQIRETVKEHFEKEMRIKRVMPEGERAKVLSLFFIDRVANYWPDDGKIRHWFVESYNEVSAQAKYQELEPLPVDQVHNGYFAAYKGIPKDTRGNTAADEDAYSLIMREKERLLDMDEPLRFIFSHSALREGWDNPNVFQICTLNESKSEIKKRQEIGRGLRLPVLENGERCFDPNINRLTIIANESYDEFARQLQIEIEDECGVKFDGRIANKKKRRTAKLSHGWRLNEDFKALWQRIKHKTRYAVAYDTAELIEKAAAKMRDMDRTFAPRIMVRKAGMNIDRSGVSSSLLAVREGGRNYSLQKIPDLLGYLQGQTELTRSTISEILIRSGRLGDVAANPQQFLDHALKAIQLVLHELMIDGIKYERIHGQEYEMLLFEEQEISGYLTDMIEVDNSIYDSVLCDSTVEKDFAEAMSKREDIKLFIKLPAWFKVETPIGTYNPDWAIVKEEDQKVYLVRETKGTLDKEKMRDSEWAKIQCGEAHFEELKIDFAHVVTADDV